jgi:hypothetical protein
MVFSFGISGIGFFVGGLGLFESGLLWWIIFCGGWFWLVGVVVVDYFLWEAGFGLSGLVF